MISTQTNGEIEIQLESKENVNERTEFWELTSVHVAACRVSVGSVFVGCNCGLHRQLQCFRTDRFLSPTPGWLIRMQYTSPSLSLDSPPTLSHPHSLYYFPKTPHPPPLAVLYIEKDWSEWRCEVLVSHHNNGCVSCMYNSWCSGMTHHHRMCTSTQTRTRTLWFSIKTSRWQEASQNCGTQNDPKRPPALSRIMTLQAFFLGGGLSGEIITFHTSCRETDTAKTLMFRDDSTQTPPIQAALCSATCGRPCLPPPTTGQQPERLVIA